jgi:hypothetical protein
MFLHRLRNLSTREKRLWKIGATVLGIGGFIKFGYFYVSRGMIIDCLEARDKSARKYLKESKDFAKFAAEDRKKRAPQLTVEQREQMQNYLLLMAQQPHNKEVYPYEMKNGKFREQ